MTPLLDRNETNRVFINIQTGLRASRRVCLNYVQSGGGVKGSAKGTQLLLVHAGLTVIRALTLSAKAAMYTLHGD